MLADSHPPARQPLAAFATILWPLFITATLVLAGIWWSGFGAGQIADPAFARTVSNPDLRAALALLSRGIDSVWITLAAVNIYIALARSEGLLSARTWAGSALGAGLAICAASTWTSLPLGPIFFPTNLGPRFGPVPFAYPFLWFVVAVGARETLLAAFPRMAHGVVAVGTGILCAGADWLIEPIAWKYRAWWLWYPHDPGAPDHAPWSSYATWFAGGALLAFIMRSSSVLPKASRARRASVVVFACFIAIAAITRAVR